VAHGLGFADSNPQGALFVGAEEWVQDIAATLKSLGITVQMMDSNPDHVERAQKRGLHAERADVLSESILKELDLSGIGRLLIAIPNNEVASLAALHLSEIFEINDIFQLPARSERRYAEDEMPKHLRGHLLFGGKTSCAQIRDRLDHEHEIYVAEMDMTISRDEFDEQFGAEAVPLFLVRDNQLIVFSEQETMQPQAGDQIVVLAHRRHVEEAEPGISVHTPEKHAAVAE